MEKKEIFIIAKAMPTESMKYDEVVCTAGITKEGDLIRIYPVPYRNMAFEQRYRKYQWIRAEVEKRAANKDKRKESYSCNFSSLEYIGDPVDTSDFWQKRKDILFGKGRKVYENFSELKAESNISNPDFISLALFKPTEIVGMYFKKRDIDSVKEKQEEIRRNRDQCLFPEEYKLIEEYGQARPMEFTVGYRFTDCTGEICSCMIEDWELYELYSKPLREWERKNPGKTASPELMEYSKNKVKQKYLDEFTKEHDIWFVMGTRMRDQMKNRPNFYSIISVIYPLKVKESGQLTLF